MGDEDLKEAALAVNVVSGLSAQMYGIGYSLEKQKQEVAAIAEHIKKSGQG